MTVSFWGLCVAELRKVRGRGLLYATLLFGAFHGVVAPLIAQLTVFAGESAMEKLAPGDAAGAPSDSLDWLVAADLSQTAVTLPVFALVFLFVMSILWAQDFSLGTLGMLVIRPVSRLKIFLSKVAVSWGLVGSCLLLAVVLGGAIGLPLFGVSGDVEKLAVVELCVDPDDSPCFPFVSWMAETPTADMASGEAAEPVALSLGRRLLGVFQGFLLALLGFGPIIGLVAAVATITRSPVLTLFGSLFVLVADALATFLFTVWASLESVGGHEIAGQLRELTLWSVRGFYRLHGTGEIFERGGGDIALTCLYTGIFLGLAGWQFIRRDLT